MDDFVLDSSGSRDHGPFHLSIHCQGLALYTSNTAQNKNAAIQYSKGTFHFNGKV
jgi:hypothetical protein